MIMPEGKIRYARAAPLPYARDQGWLRYTKSNFFILFFVRIEDGCCASVHFFVFSVDVCLFPFRLVGEVVLNCN
jgi:hypothetical protein